MDNLILGIDSKQFTKAKRAEFPCGTGKDYSFLISEG
jgi:hypothetical protein